MLDFDRIDDLNNTGVLADADAVGSFGGLAWGDAIKLTLRIDGATARIEQARYQAFGCSSAIAAASALAEMVEGKTLDDACGISAADIAEHLGGLPQERMYCAVMAYEALQNAIVSYRGITVVDADAGPSCKCFGVSQMMIERTIRFNRLTTPEQVTHHTKAAGSCSSCFKQIESLLARVNAEMVEDGLLVGREAYRIGSIPQRAVDLKPVGHAQPAAHIFSSNAKSAPAHLRPTPAPAVPKPASARPLVPPTALGAVDAPALTALVIEALEEMRPHLQRDGGDCEFVRVEDNIVFVRLTGNCVGCQLSSVTLSGVQARLADKVGRPMRVVPLP
jgi:NifU-like protein